MRSKAQALNIVDVYEEVAKNIPDGSRGSDLVLTGYGWYKATYDISHPAQRVKNGKVLECLVLDALWLHGIHPAYHQATVTNVPNVIYDVLLYHPLQPVVISCKTSLRERWKQADLEGSALKQIYRAASSILITLSAEGHRVQEQICNSNVLGLDQCIVIQDGASDFDDFLDGLVATDFTKASKIMPVTGTIMQ